MLDVIKSRKYVITLKGKTYYQRLDLCKTGAEKYGNGTCLAHYIDPDEKPVIFDTRYEIGIIKNFDEWADNFIKNWCNSDCIIEVIH